jgi:predicted TIM-barrel fold metal-dependent hydrolase
VFDPSQLVISVDDHLVEPPDLWTERVPARDRDRAPRITDLEDGKQAWIYDGHQYATRLLVSVAGKSFEEFSTEASHFGEIRAGCYSVKERLDDMDHDGVFASMCFPTFPRFCGQTFLEAPDKDFALVCLQAYNDFVLDEWAGESGGRLLPLTILPLWDPQLAEAELRRTAAKGAVAVSVSENPSALGLPSYYTDHWDPVFRAAEELGLPLCLHIGSGSKQVDTDAPDAPFSTRCVLVGLNSMVAVTDLLFSGAFAKFPDVKVVLSEGGVGWVPYILERSDYTWMRYKKMDRLNPVPPSEVFRRNVWVCMIDDQAGIDNRHTIGVDKIMWECDYPHPDTSWPSSRTRLEAMLADVPPQESAAIVAGNAQHVFGLSLPETGR